MYDFDRLTGLLQWCLECFGRVMDILNYETSNAVSALRRVDYILGEKND